MKRKWILTIGAILLTFVCVTFVFISKPKVINSWQDREKIPVLTNKSWSIKFSKKLDKDSVNQDLIFVTNNVGEKQAITLVLSKDKKTVTVLPPENGYSLEPAHFTLHIDKKVKSQFGLELLKSKSVDFVVKEDLPFVGSKAKLNQLFMNVIEQDKRERKRNFFILSARKESKSMMETANDESGEKAGQDFSETNVQVDGVDEADIVKTDGSYIYQLSDRRIMITKAKPEDEMKLEKVLEFDRSFSPINLYLFKNQLVVIGQGYDGYPGHEETKETDAFYPPRYFEYTEAIVYDIANPQNPKEIRHIKQEGYYITSRRKDGFLYLITSYFPNYWILEEKRKNMIDIRPRFSDSVIGKEPHFIEYDHIQYIPESRETNFTTIATINLEKPTEEMALTSYIGCGEQVFMSNDNLYVGVANYQDIHSWNGPISPDTSIYKFSINEDKVAFHSSVDVPGIILNQFSMDEFNENFRVVTTEGGTWNDNQSSNHLYIFDKNLRKLGELTDLARGERIYSARFMQKRIYIVTFKQVDPLFVIDASNPEKPSVVGELKIPGFSNYLHPYDENHLIGFGHDTKVVPNNSPGGGEPLVLTQGIKISLFNIQDVNHPVEMFSEVIGGRGTYSPLNQDHKALLFSKEKGLFAFPLTIYREVQGKEYEQHFEFQGAYVYDINLDGIHLMTEISHQTGRYENWENGIERLLYIGDTLYALSPTKITAHKISDFSLVGEVTLH